MSTPPPAVSGTTSLIGRLGQASGRDAGSYAARSSASAPMTCAKLRNAILVLQGTPAPDLTGHPSSYQMLPTCTKKMHPCLAGDTAEKKPMSQPKPKIVVSRSDGA